METKFKIAPDIEECCAVCGFDPQDCSCPECVVCSEVGNPDCTVNGGELCPTDIKPKRS